MEKITDSILMMGVLQYFPRRKLLFNGDLIFTGRVPFMGQAVRHWRKIMSRMSLVGLLS